MTRFIAGASTIGASVAMHRVDNKSSALPPANRAMKSALAGAISTTCAQRARLDVTHGGFRRIVPQIAAGRPARYRLKTHGGDEALRRVRHHHLHVRTAFDQSALPGPDSCTQRCLP